MKAPDFQYTRPSSLDEVFELLRSHGDSARLLAGGQTLLATLNMRLSEPSLLIDIGAVEALKGVSVRGAALRIGALTTHSEIESSALVARHAPLLAQAAPHIAHRAIRNRGTLGGSIAHADPASEWPACLLALDGVVVVQGAAGERRIEASRFFLDLYTTALAEGEVIVACEIPLREDGDLFVFAELARRLGDYASVGLAMAAQRRSKTLRRVRLAFLGIAGTPLRALRTEAALEGQEPTAEVVDRAMRTLAAELNPLADLTNSAATKRHLAGVLARRALRSCGEQTHG